MKQIMERVETRSKYNDRLRYIVCNIIDLIPELRELSIETNLSVENEANSYFEYDKITKVFESGIYMINDIEFFKDDISFELKSIITYFDMMGIKETEIDIAKYIFVCLHELGHIEDFYKNRDNYRNLTILQNAFRGLSILAVDITNEIESHIHYIMQPAELYADKFAFRYFQYIWNNLKIRNLI